LHGDFIVPKLTVHGNLVGNFENTFQFATLNEQLQQLTQRRWRNLVVHGNAYWNDTAIRSSSISTKQYEQLQYLYRHAVRRSGDQAISGTVYMTQPLISRMRTRTTFPNGVDLAHIARDCLLKNTTAPQTIVGAKLFHKPLRLQRALVEGPLAITTLNAVDVQLFHASLYRRSSGVPIGGPLYFKVAPIIGQLIVQGQVNGMPTSQVYTPARGALPPVRVHNLVIDDALQIGDINGQSFDYLLKNRIKLNGEPQEVQGYLIFEHLVTNNETLLQSINGVPIDDLIYKKSDQLQVIAGQKLIDGNLIFNGPSHVTRLNGQRLVDAYQQSIFTTANYHFDNLTIDQGIFVKGLVLVADMPLHARGRTLSNSTADRTEDEEPALDEANLLEEHTNQLAGDDAFREQLTIAVNQLSNLLSARNATSLLADEQNAHLLYLDFDFDTQVLRQYANESVDETFLYEQRHVTPCEHRFLQVQSALHNRRLFITNVTTSFLYANAGAISAKAQNYCGDRFKKIKSKITVNGLKVAKVFGMRKYIESIELFVDAKNHTYLLLHAIDEARNRNEVRVLRIDDALDEVKDWQTIPFGIGKSVQLYQLDNLTVLASAALVGNQQAVSIYHFMPQTAHFKLAQVIDGPYDVMALVAVEPHHYQLLLSCHKCQHVNVYDLSSAPADPYKLFQLIKLPIRVDKLHPFAMSDGEQFLLILGEQQQDFYHLYKYASIQGWLHSSVGYFRNIQLAVPLSGMLAKWKDAVWCALLRRYECELIK
ncbi:PREDICTED: uncharacterized protein LOC108381711, partial [Rhagoletis zephyria]|uniref:uncharacterized protein LOC108381711 n=1 Tax=Rhagoletis zephyria TaxID=28612 RepID=UPI0008118CC2